MTHCRHVAGLKGELLPEGLDERWVASPRKGQSLRHRDGRTAGTEVPRSAQKMMPHSCADVPISLTGAELLGLTLSAYPFMLIHFFMHDLRACCTQQH